MKISVTKFNLKNINKNFIRYLFVFVLLFFISPNSYGNNDPYSKNYKIDVLNYIFDITLSDATDVISCEVTVDFRIQGNSVNKLGLDLIKMSEELNDKGMIVKGVSSDDGSLNFVHEKDKLWIFFERDLMKNKRKKVKIRYSGIPAEGLHIGKNKYGDRTFFSDNWPNRGRHWLATVDHPYDKASCEFIVTAPNHYQVVSNGLKIEETNLEQNQKLTHWKQSVPIASWLYVLGVAEFAVQYVDEFDGKSIQTWVFKQDRDAGFYDFAIPTKKALEFYSDYVGPYSYEKLANIQSNSVSGGMEAASAILYSANSVKGDRNERWRNVVIHEIAHQWFGNSVTESDWDDVWLSEGFATYFTLLFIEHYYGQNAFVEGLLSSKQRVESFHKKNPNYTIIHDDLKNMEDVTSSQTYQKGSWVLHMLRGYLGNDLFWKGIRNYYSEFKDSNATTQDFQRVMEETSGKGLKHFFQQWLYNPGKLEVDGKWTYDKKRGEIHLEMNQIQKSGELIEMPVEISLNYKNHKKIKKIQLKGKSKVYKLKSSEKPIQIMIDPNFWVLMNSQYIVPYN